MVIYQWTIVHPLARNRFPTQIDPKQQSEDGHVTPPLRPIQQAYSMSQCMVLPTPCHDPAGTPRVTMGIATWMIGIEPSNMIKHEGCTKNTRVIQRKQWIDHQIGRVQLSSLYSNHHCYETRHCSPMQTSAFSTIAFVHSTNMSVTCALLRLPCMALRTHGNQRPKAKSSNIKRNSQHLHQRTQPWNPKQVSPESPLFFKPGVTEFHGSPKKDAYPDWVPTRCFLFRGPSVTICDHLWPSMTPSSSHLDDLVESGATLVWTWDIQYIGMV